MKYAVVVKGREDILVVAASDEARIAFVRAGTPDAWNLLTIGEPDFPAQPQCIFCASEIVGIYALIEEDAE